VTPARRGYVVEEDPGSRWSLPADTATIAGEVFQTMASGSQHGAGMSVREERFDWVDRSLALVVVANTALVVAGGIVQVSFGIYSMTMVEAWRTVFAREVILDPNAWQAFAFGTELPEMSTDSVIAWNTRLPRVLVAVIVGSTLAI
jgi:iron complex transport system permease protein